MCGLEMRNEAEGGLAKEMCLRGWGGGKSLTSRQFAVKRCWQVFSIELMAGQKEGEGWEGLK